MSTLTTFRGTRPLAVVPAAASYRLQPGRLATFAGHVRVSAVARPSAAPAPAPSEASKAA